MICESKPKFNTYDPVFGEAFRFRCAAGKSLKISFFDHDVGSVSLSSLLYTTPISLLHTTPIYDVCSASLSL